MHGGSFKGHVGGVKNLADIFRALAQDRQSGTLTISEYRRRKQIYFEQGSITLLSSTKRMRIGELLVSTGKITEDDLELAIKLQKQNRLRLGEILVEEEFCNEEDIRRIVKYQVEGEIYDCFLWLNADYEFFQGQKPEELQSSNRQIVRLEIDTNSLVVEALHRLEEWRNSIRPLVPSTKEIYLPTGRNPDGINLPDKLREIFPQIAGQHSVQQLADMAHLSDFEICKYFAMLVKMGVLRPLSTEDLIKKSSEAQALNDFASAVTFLCRLEEIYPQDLKILMPLADAFRQLGQVQDAMPVYEKVTAILHADGDEDALKRCWTTMYGMDPTREDLFNHLQAIEAKALAIQQRQKRVIPWIIMGLITSVLVAFIVSAYMATQKKKLLNKERSEEIATQIIHFKNLKKAQQWKEAHGVGLALLTKYAKTDRLGQTKGLTLPLTIETVPVGFTIYVNDVRAGSTSLITSMVVADYDPRKGRVKVTLKHGSGTGVALQYQILEERAQEDSSTGFDPWRFSSLKLSVSGLNKWVPFAEAHFTSGIGYLPKLKKYVAGSREGQIFRLNQAGKVGDNPIIVGQFGDVLSGIAVSENQAFVGLSVGGVHRIEINENLPESDEFYEASGPVHGTPLVTRKHVVFGSHDGHIYVYKRRGGLLNKIEGAGYYPHKGIIRNKGKDAIFVGSDGYLHNINVLKAEESFRIDLGQRPISAPIDCGDNVAVLLQGGIAAITSSSQVSDPIFIRARGLAPFGLAGDKTSLFLASHGRLMAYSLATQKALWKQEFSSKPNGYSHVALVKNRVIFSCGDRLIYGINRQSGRMVWTGDLGSSWITNPFSVFDDHVLVILKKRTIGKLIPFYSE
jgi:outer membrane protein assembly factor BamB